MRMVLAQKASSKAARFKLCLCIELWQLIGPSPVAVLCLAGAQKVGMALPAAVISLQFESYSRQRHDHHLVRPPSRTPLLLPRARNLDLRRASGYPRRSDTPALPQTL